MRTLLINEDNCFALEGGTDDTTSLKRMKRNEQGVPSPWRQVDAWMLQLPLVYFFISGILPSANSGVAMRLSGTGTDPSSFTGRSGILIMTIVCLLMTLPRLEAASRECIRMKASFGLCLLAFGSIAWSQIPQRSFANSASVLTLSLFAVYLTKRFSPLQLMQLLTMAGTTAIVSSFLLVAAAPSIAVESTSGAWRGIFGAKNNCGEAALFALIPMLYIPASGGLQKLWRAIYMASALLLMVKSQARSAWCVTVCVFLLAAVLRALRRFTRKDAAVLSLMLFVIAGLALCAVVASFSSILSLLGKDPTISQRTIIWSAAWTSILKHPWLGYGYAAFWNGLEGESLNNILISGWMQSQAQNGFIDLWLQLGIGGLLLFAVTVLTAFRDFVSCFTAGGRHSEWCFTVIVVTLLYNTSESNMFAPRQIYWLMYILACAGLSQAARNHRRLED